MKDITKKQKEVLVVIGDLLGDKAVVSLRDIKVALKYKSVNSVVDHLRLLEKKGYVRRDINKKGSIQLTQEALLRIGKPGLVKRGGISKSTNIDTLELKPHQKTILASLSEIDKRIGNMYLGALRVLEDETNPERFAQSAHSMREMTNYLTRNLESLVTEINSRTTSTVNRNARKVEIVFDPRGGVKPLGKTIYDEWNQDYHSEFTEMSHHGERKKDYLELLSEFESFLLRYVLPTQMETYDQIDSILKLAIKKVDFKDLRNILTKNYETYRYFYKNVGVGWLKALKKNELLPPSVEVADYLKRIASHKTANVSGIILATDSRKLNNWIKMTFIRIATDHFDPIEMQQMIAKIGKEKWIEKEEALLISDVLVKLFEKLIYNRDYKNAENLFHILLRVKKSKRGLERAEPYIQDYELNNLLGVAKSIPPDNAKFFINALKQCLTSIIDIDSENGVDYSSVWMPDISGKKNRTYLGFRDHVTNTFREMLFGYVKFFSEKAIPTKELDLDRLLPGKYSIFIRIRLYIYHSFSLFFSHEINDAILAIDNDNDAWHDYLILIHDSFHLLTEESQRAFWEKFDDLNAGDKRDVLHVIKTEIPPKYSKLVSETGITPTIPNDIGVSWVGPTSPKKNEELGKMSFDELKQFLIDWRTEDDWRSPSYLGLSRALSELVKSKPAYFSKKAGELYDDSIRPVYYYNFFVGMRDGLRNEDAEIDWRSIMKLMSLLTDLYKKKELPIFKTSDELESDWDGVFQWMMSFLDQSLRDPKNTPDISFRAEIFDIIKTFCSHSDPSPENEKYGDNMSDPYTNAINSVRGNSFLALIHYVIWTNRAKDKPSITIDKEVKTIIEEHSDHDIESSLAVRSVLGLYFPSLYMYDKEWAATISDKLFPEDNPSAMMAAWNMYMKHNIYREVYNFMKPVCIRVINSLKKKKEKLKSFNKPDDELAHYVTLGYLYKIDSGEESLLKSYFNEATHEQKGLVISYIGRAYINGDMTGKNKPDFDLIKSIWEWRLKESSSSVELQEFGWWVSDRTFEVKWTLTKLLETLQKTQGIIDYEYNLFKVLEKVCTEYPDLVTDILSLYVNNRNNHNHKIFGHMKQIRSILAQMINSGNRSKIMKIIDTILKLGYDDLRDILRASDTEATPVI